MKFFKTICATALIVLGVTFAITASSKEEEMSTIPEGCEVMDDIEEYIMMGAQLGGGLVVMTTCGPSLVGQVLAYGYDWDTRRYVYYCEYTGSWEDFCVLSQTSAYNE